ncbi:MAG: Flp pilus assembly protein CpaB [Phycisphaerae bacterium]|jgi:Flp pilus assembly protein CpaB
MKRKAIIPLVLGLGIGLFTVKLAVDTIRKAQAANEGAKPVKVVWATHDIRPFEAITPDMVGVVETTESLFVPESERFDSVDLVIGRVTKKAIPGRTPVLESLLAPQGTEPGLIGRIPPGFRAVSVKIDEVTSVGYQLKPGDMVDVSVVMDVDAADGRGKDTISEVILQNVEVAAIGHTTDIDEQATGSNVKPAKSATLFVRIADVTKLHLASTRGRISLAMCGEGGQVAEGPTGATMDQLLGRLPRGLASAQSDGIPLWARALGFGADADDGGEPEMVPQVAHQRPLQPQEPPHTVMVYRGSFNRGQDGGTTVEQITFQNGDSAKIVAVTQGPPTRGAAALGGSDRDVGAVWRQNEKTGDTDRTGPAD